ncbi:hypothetical protein L1987_54262 [Smallanthus sonchifolius]|uniref:Uncharacterized protein n=1 Tax=Smallanthus sonchifolius TaxID=185202 RepID=A0ACB9E652_9ASTR|nr:hypothetical protein L1987_54262 [Smallanthus sonchifolius]
MQRVQLYFVSFGTIGFHITREETIDRGSSGEERVKASGGEEDGDPQKERDSDRRYLDIGGFSFMSP